MCATGIFKVNRSNRDSFKIDGQKRCVWLFQPRLHLNAKVPNVNGARENRLLYDSEPKNTPNNDRWGLWMGHGLVNSMPNLVRVRARSTVRDCFRIIYKVNE